LLQKQFAAAKDSAKPRLVNVSGGLTSAMSLRQIHSWCDTRFGPHPVTSDARPRRFDLPWVILDSRLARATWGWQPVTSTAEIMEEIAAHAEAHPEWLSVSAPD